MRSLRRSGRVSRPITMVAAGALVTGLVQCTAIAPASAAGTTPTITQSWSVTLDDAGGPIAESSPNVANLPGGPAVVVGDRAGHVYALELSNGDTVAGWPFSTGGVPVDSTPSVWSSTPGGLDNVLVGVGNAADPHSGGYQAISPQGSSEWLTTVPALPGGSTDAAVQASMAIGQLQGTTAAVAGPLGQEADALNATSGSVLPGFPWFQADSNFSSPAIADLYGTGQNEIVEGGDSTAGGAYGTTYHNGGHLRILSQTGNAGTGSPNGGLDCQYNTDQTIQSSPAVGRFLGNGAVMGVAVGTSTYYAGASTTDDVLALDRFCNLVWSRKLDGSTSSSPALADVVGEGRDDVVEGTNNGSGGGSVWVLDGSTGQTVWQAATTGEVIGSVVTADLAGQGYQDPIVPTTDGVDIFDGRSGALVATLGSGLGFQNSPLVTQDPDGTIGITIAGYNGSMAGVVTHYEVQDTDAASVYGPGAWPMFRHDPQLTGFSSSVRPLPLAAPDLVTDSSFEQGLGPWQVAGGQNWAIYPSASAPVGGGYLETNAGTSPDPNVYQDAIAAPLQGHSYQGSLYLRSPSAVPINVALVIWATGGSATEVGQSQFTVSSASWTQFSTDVDVSGAGHSSLIFQLYISTNGPSIDLDGASLRDAGVSDAGFNQGLGPWTVAPGQNWAVYSSPTSPMGGGYLETNAGSSSDPNIYQDVSLAVSPGHTYQGSLYLRSPSSTPVSVSLVIWATGGSATEVGQSQFTVSSSSWTRFSTDLDVAGAGHTSLCLQLYSAVTGSSLDIDGASLQDTDVADAAFDQPDLGPWVVAPGANWDIGTGSGAPFGSGQSWLQTNTGSDSSSWFYQDVATTPVPGQSYTGSIFLKSLTGGDISVAVVVWAEGGPDPTEVGQTVATIGPSWQQVTAEVDVANPGHDDLRFQVYVGTPGQTLGATFAQLPDVARD